MNEIIKIEYAGNIVLTTEQLAQAYECDISNIQDNYRKNQSRFEEGIHFFKLDGDELKDFKSRLPENFRSAGNTSILRASKGNTISNWKGKLLGNCG